MHFDLSDDQRLLQESLNRFVVERYGFEHRQEILAHPDGYSRRIWSELAELGMLGLPFAEEEGGFGGTGVEMMLVMEAMGRGLVVEPYLATVVLAGGVLREAGNTTQRRERLPSIMGGATIMALAHHEAGGRRHSTRPIHCRARRDGDGWMLGGAKIAVIGGHAADELIVSAACGGEPSLFLVDPRTAGVGVIRRTGYDGIALAEITFDDVHVSGEALIGAVGEGADILQRVFEEANAALVAEAVGIMDDLLATTLDYLRTRTQFGVAIGSFQALQHRATDMMMEIELARSMSYLAAGSLALGGDARRRNIAAAKARVGRAARFVGQQAVQLHGAIGLTAEYKVGHAFKRLTAIDVLFGDADYHFDQLEQVGGLLPL